MAKLANAPDLGSGGSGLGGSTPLARTMPGCVELVDQADLNSAAARRPGSNPGPGTNSVDPTLGELTDDEPAQGDQVEGQMEAVGQSHDRILTRLLGGDGLLVRLISEKCSDRYREQPLRRGPAPGQGS